MIKNENIKVLLLYLLIIIIIYASVVFCGKSLITSLSYPLGVTEKSPFGYQGRKPVNVFNIDNGSPSYYEAPINKLIGEYYLSGELPLWNPYQAAGTPLAAQYSSRAFFPYQIAEDISPYWLWDFFILGRLLIAAFFTYLFLRSLSVSIHCAFLGGVFYAFFGTFTWFINSEQFVNVAMMVPILLFSIESLVKKKSNISIAICAFVLALSLLAGQPEISFYLVFLMISYFIFRITTTDHPFKERVGHCLRIAIVGILGLGISAILIFPFFELVTNSFHIHPAGGAQGVVSRTPIHYLISILLPTFFRIPTSYRITPDNGIWDYLGGYCGVVVVFFILLGFFLQGSSQRRNKPFIFFSLFGLVIILQNLGFPVIKELGRLPLFDQCWGPRWSGPVWTFSFVTAASLALNSFASFCKTETDSMIAKKDIFVWSSGIFLLLMSISLGIFLSDIFPQLYLKFIFQPKLKIIAYSILFLGGFLGLVLLWKSRRIFKGSIKTIFAAAVGSFVVSFLILFMVTMSKIARYYLPTLGSFEAGFFHQATKTGITAFFLIVLLICLLFFRCRTKGFVYGVIALSIFEAWFYIPKGYGIKSLDLEFIILFFSLFLAFAIGKDKRKIALAGVAIWICAVALLDLKSSFGLPDKYNPFKEAPYVKFLKDKTDNFRIMASDGILMPNFPSAVGLYDVRYINALTIEPYHDFVGELLEKPLSIGAFYTGTFHFDLTGRGTSAGLWFTGIADVSGDRKVMQEYWEEIEKRRIENIIPEFLPYYSLLGVKYFITPTNIDLNKQTKKMEVPVVFPLIYQDEVKIYENPSVLPRAFVVSHAEYVPSYQEALLRVKEEGLNLKNKVIIEERLPGNLSVSGRKRTAKDETSITEYKPSRVVIESKFEQAGFLVLSDTYYPGWKAYVDGRLTKIYRANAIMRAVFLEEGRHTVIFQYSPESFKIGLAISLLSLIFIMILLITGFKRRFSAIKVDKL